MAPKRNPLDMIFATTGLGYAGIWDRGAIQLTASRLRRRSGELHGELLVECGVVAVGHGRLHRAAFNFSSSSMRERLGKQLAARARTADTIPWSDHLEEFCAAVLEADQEGLPIVTVGNLEKPQEEGWLLAPFLPLNKTSMIYAAGMTGKSYLAVLCAVAVATGTDVLGWKVMQRGQVLYLDWETDAHEVNERLGRVARGLGIDTPTILYRPCVRSLDYMAEDLASVVSDNRVKLVIVDSVGMASGTAHEGSSAEESAIKLFTALRLLETTVLCIDHVTGEDAGSSRAVHKAYGSIYKMNLARSVWELKGTLAEEGQESHLAMFHRKVNSGRLLPAVGISVVHGPDSVTFQREEVQDEELIKGLTNSARVQRCLAGGSKTVPEIAEATGLTEAGIRVVLSRGRGTMFGKRTDGSWGLLYHEPPPKGDDE